MEYTEIRDKFGQHDFKTQKYQLQMILDGGRSGINGYPEKITDRDIEIQLGNMRDRIQERTGSVSKDIRILNDNQAYKSTIGNTERLRESHECNKNKYRGKHSEVMINKPDNIRFHTTERSLLRVKKSQDKIKTEMNEIRSMLESKLSKVEENYTKLMAGVQELGHLVELGTFVNNRIERVNIRERLVIELNKSENSCTKLE